MKPHKQRLPLFWKLMTLIIACWFGLLAITFGVTLRFSLNALQEKIDEILLSTVQSLSDAPGIQEILRTGTCPQEIEEYLDNVVRYTEDLDYITIADTNSIRIYHIDPSFVGLPFEGGDQHRALSGECYLSDAGTNNFSAQRRAFHPIFDSNGEVMGFVMASATHSRIHQLRRDIYEAYIRLFLTLLMCTLIFCFPLAVFLGRNLRGARPEDLLRIYLTQNDILNALDNGLISFDNTGKVRLVNSAASRMLGHREDLLVGRQVDELLRCEDGTSLRNRTNGVLQSDRTNILVRPVQLPDSNLWARQVLLLSDKTEVARYLEELGGTRHMLTALRANTHEFLNKLQVISGLLQMGRVQDAQTYIGSLSSIHEQIISPIMKLIHNSNVAALILGKEANMRELDITLTLLNNSSLPEHSRYLSTSELVTVVGNLLENAIEAVNAAPADGVRIITLQLTEDDKGLLILVSDTGEGILPEDLPHIFKNGFSTKAQSGRGTGMKLISDITDRHGGSIDVDTEPGSGTTFSIIFSRERGAAL
jgi:CitB family two-component system sensor histidine kinase MalK/two-component system sensor histidine kinase DctS